VIETKFAKVEKEFTVYPVFLQEPKQFNP